MDKAIESGLKALVEKDVRLSSAKDGIEEMKTKLDYANQKVTIHSDGYYDNLNRRYSADKSMEDKKLEKENRYKDISE